MSATLDVSKLTITRNPNVPEKIPNEKLIFGKYFTPHMLTVQWTKEEGWGVPEIKPHGPISLDPSACVLHYASELFEGLKAYRTKNNKITMFRPDQNMARMNRSASRICLPNFDTEALIKMIGKLLEIDQQYIPEGQGYSMYIRPTMIGTAPGLGPDIPDTVLLYVILCPVGPYYRTGFNAVRLEATDYATRAWPGGAGNSKLGLNYALCFEPHKIARSRGYEQNLWLFGPEKNVTEVGSMNVFFVFGDKNTGKKELVTAPLDGTILEGVTRDSILTLARERLNPDEWTISERYFTIEEVKERAAKQELVEAFGSGTAAIVCPIKEIGWQGSDIQVPLLDGEQSGALAKELVKWISDLQYGNDKYANWTRVVADLN